MCTSTIEVTKLTHTKSFWRPEVLLLDGCIMWCLLDKVAIDTLGPKHCRSSRHSLPRFSMFPCFVSCCIPTGFTKSNQAPLSSSHLGCSPPWIQDLWAAKDMARDEVVIREGFHCPSCQGPRCCQTSIRLN